MSRKRPASAVAVVVLALAAGASVAAEGEPRGVVLLPSGHTLRVEIADTPEERERGYMFREKISDKEGMIFLMESLDFHSFWMKNCKVSLDIAWLDESWRVVHLETDVPPCKEEPCAFYSPMQASLYVLEVRAGLASKNGLRPGAYITFTPPAPSPKQHFRH